MKLLSNKMQRVEGGLNLGHKNNSSFEQVKHDVLINQVQTLGTQLDVQSLSLGNKFDYYQY